MDFYERWGIRHRLSSVSLPSSNGRAELAVKTAKRLLMENISPNGVLDTDKMVRALLTYRNTPDPGCKLSPAEILLGRKLKDCLPTINKDIMTFNNPQIHHQWRDAWNAKEEALRTRYVKTLENMSEHSRPLPNLQIGDHVMIQNQTGNHPKKWDKSGVVVEIKLHDQYVVKVSGSGRLTLRNRRFLRKYDVSHIQPTTSYSTIVPPLLSQTCHSTSTSIHTPLGNATTPNAHHNIQQPGVNISLRHSVYDDDNSDNHGVTSAPPTPPATTPSPSSYTPRRLTFGEVAPEEVPLQAPTPVMPPHTGRRSLRSKCQRTVYDAATGEYAAPKPVPNDM